jgi:hypothetical protein
MEATARDRRARKKLEGALQVVMPCHRRLVHFSHAFENLPGTLGALLSPPSDTRVHGLEQEQALQLEAARQSSDALASQCEEYWTQLQQANLTGESSCDAA